MGGKSSREGSLRGNSSLRSSSSSSSWGGYSQSPYGQDSQIYSTQQSFSSPQYAYPPPSPQYVYPPPQAYPPPQDYDVGYAAPDGRRRLDRKYSRIADNYNSLDQVKIIGNTPCRFLLFFCWLFEKKSQYLKKVSVAKLYLVSS